MATNAPYESQNIDANIDATATDRGDMDRKKSQADSSKTDNKEEAAGNDGSPNEEKENNGSPNEERGNDDSRNDEKENAVATDEKGASDKELRTSFEAVFNRIAQQARSDSKKDVVAGLEEKMEGLKLDKEGEEYLSDCVKEMLVLCESSAWSVNLKETLQNYPVFETQSDGGKPTNCEVCRRPNHNSKEKVEFKGLPYNKDTFKKNEDVPKLKLKRSYNMGPFCYLRTKDYHALYHSYFNIYEKIKSELQKETSDLIALKEKSFKRLKELLYRIENGYQDCGGNRCNVAYMKKHGLL